MSFKVKHYVAIGLGFAVFTGYAMHKSTSPNTPVAFDTHSGEFKPLSSFEYVIGDVPRIVSSEPELVPQQNKISTLQLAIESEGGAQQVTFDTGTTQSEDNNDFTVPAFVDDDIIELGSMPREDTGEHEAVLADPTTRQLATESAFVTAERSYDSGQKADSHLDQSNSQWYSNPSSNPATTSQAKAPDVDHPIAKVRELAAVTNDSIIVEPVSENSDHDLAAMSDSVDPSAPTQLETETEKSVKSDPAQPVQEPAKTPALAPAVDQLENVVEVVAATIPLSETAAQQAVHHIEYGKSLSRRGAAFAARQEFYSALRIIAESNDAATCTHDYTKALSQAILAMKEAEDFVQINTEAEMLLEVLSITETHRSRIIDQTLAVTTSPAQAMERYFAYAQEKLDQASGRNPVSAEVLFCLGKLHTAVSKSKIVPDRVDVARAVAYHQAALLSDKNNFRSANELGVLMVQSGQLEQATELFRQSLIAQPTPQAWENLAKTHRRLGQLDLAHLADEEFALLSQTPITNSNAAIRWLPVSKFNAKPPMEFRAADRIAARPEKPTETSKTTSEKVQTKIKSFGTRLKELF